MAKKEIRLLTVQDIAERLGVSERTVRRYAFDRDLKYTRYNDTILVTEEDLKEFLQKSAIEGRSIKATAEVRRRVKENKKAK